MKLKLLVIAAVLASAAVPTFGQAAVPMATPAATETFAIVPDGPNHDFELKWDIYLPPTVGQSPAVLVIFGGRFMGGGRSDVGAIATYLASQGFVALAIDYRVDQQNPRTGQQVPVYAPPAIPNQPGDVKLAVTAARTGVIPSGNSIIQGLITGKVGAVGGSSGASHALWCAATGTLSTDKLDAAVLFSGAYQFDDPASLGWRGDRLCRYGSNGPTFCPDVNLYCQVTRFVCSPPISQALHEASPIYQVDADVSPLFWISDNGDAITPSQFFDLKNWLNSLRVNPNLFKSVWVTAPGFECNHSFDNWSLEQDDVTDWLRARLTPDH
jgi:dienelactone hydrolase